MEFFLVFVVMMVVYGHLAVAAEPDPPEFFRWYKEIDGADALPEAYYVETACVYWAGIIPILPASPGPFAITGEFPRARFFSIESYHHDVPVDGLTDFQIEPDKGSINPFKAGNRYPSDGKNLFYTLRLVEITDKSEIPENRPPNTLYVTRHKGERAYFYVFLYRVYWNPIGDGVDVPQGYTRREWEKRGQKPLVQVVIHERGECAGAVDTSSVEAEVSDTVRSRVLERFTASRKASASREANGEPAKETPWVIGNPKVGFGNSAIVYLLANFDDSHGEVAVCRFKAPTFPNTKNGEIIDPQAQQTRYWSACTHIPGTMTTIDCISDYNFIIDDDGYVTLVLSSEENRPANAKNWLPYGWDEVNQRYGALVFLRNLVPSEALFPESAFFYAEACRWCYSPESPEYLQCLYDDRTIENFTGDYYPTSYYCPKREFERHGPRLP